MSRQANLARHTVCRSQVHTHIVHVSGHTVNTYTYTHTYISYIQCTGDVCAMPKYRCTYYMLTYDCIFPLLYECTYNAKLTTYPVIGVMDGTAGCSCCNLLNWTITTPIIGHMYICTVDTGVPHSSLPGLVQSLSLLSLQQLIPEPHCDQ